MKRKVLSSFALLTVLIPVFASITIAQSRSELEVYQLVNRERSRMRLGSLQWDEQLAKVARDYSRQMAREGFFDHYDPRGKTVMDRARTIPNWSEIGENLFVCDAHDEFTSTALRGWLKSRPHRTNMLDRKWIATGIGVAEARDGSIYITQVFTR
jgi:uncharacterized protein YkwD